MLRNAHNYLTRNIYTLRTNDICKLFLLLRRYSEVERFETNRPELDDKAEIIMVN